jgi:thiamine biosynthesis protein ThiS
MQSMQVTVNGESRVLTGALTLEDLLRDFGVDQRKVAVERNLEIVPKSTFGTVMIEDGDRLEVVHFIGGG